MRFYKIIGGDGRQYGPASEKDMRQWLAEGRLSAQSLVQPEGTLEWKALGSLPEFGAAPAADVPPVVAPPPPSTPLTDQILDRPVELRFGECLAAGFRFPAAHPGFVLGAVTLNWLLQVAMGYVPLIGGLLKLVLSGALTGGLYLACLRRMRGESVGIGNIFDGFKTGFVQLMLAGVLTSLLSGLAAILCLLPGLYLTVAWIFALPLVADQRLEFWSAMMLSLRVATRVWLQLAALLALLFLPFAAVQLLIGIKAGGMIYGILQDANFDLQQILNTLPTHAGELVSAFLVWGAVSQLALLVCQWFATGALLRAYENLFGKRAA